MIFWTAHKTYLSVSSDIPYVYDYDELAKERNSLVARVERRVTSSMTLWMSQQGLYLVRRHLDPADRLQGAAPGSTTTSISSTCASRRARCMSDILRSFGGFSRRLGQPYNTRCIIYSYRDGWWSQGDDEPLGRHHRLVSPRRRSWRTVWSPFEHELGDFYSHARAAVRGDVRSQSDVGRAADHGQANDPRHRGRTRQSPVLAVLSQLAFDRRARATDDAACRCARTATSISAPRGVTFGLRLEVAAQPVLPSRVGQHLVDAVPRGDR